MGGYTEAQIVFVSCSRMKIKMTQPQAPNQLCCFTEHKKCRVRDQCARMCEPKQDAGCVHV